MGTGNAMIVLLFFSFLLSLTVSLGALVTVYWDRGVPFPPIWEAVLDPMSLSLIALPFIFVTWLLAWHFRRSWLVALGMLLTIAPAVAGIYLELPATPLVVAVIGALTTSDLASFHERLAQSAKDDNVTVLARKHLLWAVLFVIIATGLGVGSLNRTLRLTFEWVVVLVLLGILGVAQLIRWLRREGME
jgi:hypothetical protein